MTQFNEQQLVDSILRGDRSALAALLDRYQKRIYNLVLRMVNNRDDAAELAQDAMLKIVEHIHDFRGQSSIWTWMARIAMNLSISHLRKRKLRQGPSLDGPDQGGDAEGRPVSMREQIADHRELSPDSGVQRQELVAQLKQSLAGLDEEFRAVLVLRDIGDCDYEQIAQILAIPVGTVKSRLFRARLALRHEMMKLAGPTHHVAAPRE